MDILKIRNDFLPLKNSNLVYLDSAASSLKPTVVSEAIKNYYDNYGCNVNRGTYNLSYEATEIVENARSRVAEFINAKEEEVIFTRGASQALNMVANSYANLLNEGDEIIVSELEHHSSILPWQIEAKKRNLKLIYVPLSDEGRITVDNFKSVLTSKTKVVALTHVSNVMGYVTPIKEIVELAHSVGAVVSLDAAQSIPHMKVDVKELGVDFLSFSFHKMCGPTGIGILYGKKKYLKKMPPVEYGGDMNDNVDKYDVTYKEIPHKFETGTPSIAEIFGVTAAIDYVENIGFETIENYVLELRNYVYNKLKDVKGITIYNPNADTGIITFNINNVHAHDSVTYFSDHDICLRAGHHCAQLLVKWLDVPSTIRASFYFYNTFEECDKFVNAVKEAVKFFESVGF